MIYYLVMKCQLYIVQTTRVPFFKTVHMIGCWNALSCIWMPDFTYHALVEAMPPPRSSAAIFLRVLQLLQMAIAEDDTEEPRRTPFLLYLQILTLFSLLTTTQNIIKRNFPGWTGDTLEAKDLYGTLQTRPQQFWWVSFIYFKGL